MKMREYVDVLRGQGSWDRMHDLIDQQQTHGWDLIPIEVDGVKVSIFPGHNREVTLQEVQDEVRKAMDARLYDNPPVTNVKKDSLH